MGSATLADFCFLSASFLAALSISVERDAPTSQRVSGEELRAKAGAPRDELLVSHGI